MRESDTINKSDLLALADDRSLIGRVFYTEEARIPASGLITDLKVQNVRSLVISLEDQRHFKPYGNKFIWRKSGFIATYSAPDELTLTGIDDDESFVIWVSGGWKGWILPEGALHPPVLFRR